MTDAPINHKIKALELANQHAAPPADVVTRATHYHAFLAGSAAPAAGAATAGAANTAKTTAGATAGATPPKTPAAGAAKPGAAGAANKPAAGAAGANKPAAGAAKPGAAGAANKPAAGAAKTPAAGAAKPAAGAKPGAGASAGAIPGDTKAPDGVHTYAEVVAKLREVSGDNGANRDAAFKILDDNGGAKSVRELKPANYDAVVAAAEALLAGGGDAAGADDSDPLGDPPEQTAGGLAADMDPTAQAPRDDMGL